MSHFLQYWKTDQADILKGKPLNHAASAQFNRVSPGDVVWVTVIRNGRLKLLGRIHVAEIVGQKEAAARLGDIYEAPLHIMAKPDTVLPTIELDIQDIAPRLRFNSKNDRLSFDDPEKTDGKQLQTLRELTEESAQLLTTILTEDNGKANGSRQQAIHSEKNPPWSRDELILALDLYFRHNPSGIGQNHPAVRELSDVLNIMGRRLGRIQNEKFRNPNGVYMKLCNFLRFDPSYSGKGLRAGGRMEEEIWNEFVNRRDDLRLLAQSIIEIVRDESQPLTTFIDEEDDREFPEGTVLYRTHLRRERNRELVRNAKEQAKKQSGSLCCEACGFDFHVVYGDIGEDFVECHHTIPVSELKPGSKTRIADIALLCANCHRMVHRRRPWLKMHELRTLIQRNNK